MAQPGVPGAEDSMELPCGERVHPHDLDLGMRAYDCSCGGTHAVVTDAHPLARFVPEALVATLQEVVETDDGFDRFTTAHVLAMVHEEFPDRLARADCADDGHVGYALVWVSEFDTRELHVVVVELLVELMDHAVGHAENDAAAREFETQLAEFDVDSFVDAYRRKRNFDDEFDSPA
jgi:hypothetical protein